MTEIAVQSIRSWWYDVDQHTFQMPKDSLFPPMEAARMAAEKMFDMFRNYSDHT